MRSQKAQKVASYAARFAGKEAVLKAFGTGLREGKLREIEIINDELVVRRFFNGFFCRIGEKKNITSIYITLSHTKKCDSTGCVWRGVKDESYNS